MTKATASLNAAEAYMKRLECASRIRSGANPKARPGGQASSNQGEFMAFASRPRPSRREQGTAQAQRARRGRPPVLRHRERTLRALASPLRAHAAPNRRYEHRRVQFSSAVAGFERALCRPRPGSLAHTRTVGRRTADIAQPRAAGRLSNLGRGGLVPAAVGRLLGPPSGLGLQDVAQPVAAPAGGGNWRSMNRPIPSTA